MKKELKKEDMKNLSYKDIAYFILEKNDGGLNTLDLFTDVINKLELPLETVDAKIGDFYTSLTTDKRFLMVDGLWDLRVRHTSDKLLSQVDEDDDEENYEENEEEIDEDDVDSFDDTDDLDDTYDDTDDDGLSDLVVIDEDDMDSEN